ncbi:HoxN/HupN/NixA family nickel/cobalt transporter [Paraburkholderia phenoliruptrix]|uniref:HoxN/HupN/NixA family nickel/cobalt transporter n=1 Tax=Paraburkholderia phenoliruptrix TaxID=252970 RepID=UPI001CB7701B|nr:HoxN/HupN/NixA family nickel/cobalt transporter [Paraburkholderia phenoliruptrix]
MSTRPVAAMGGFIALLHLVGWGTLLALVAPLHRGGTATALGIGAGIAAYALGMRHAFDADHIAAIDNTTRKLVGEGKPCLSVGFWFSFGHSSIVFGLSLLIAVSMRSVSSQLVDSGSTLRTVTGVLGAVISSGFLFVIALLNVAAFRDIYRVFRQMKSGRYDDAYLAQRLESRGLVNRVLAPLMRIVSKPAQMYLVGLLFGLGFDTATEIALLVLTGSGAASGLPWYAILCLPVLFAAGMLLFDTIDGSFMSYAYRWALDKPVRKIYYNLVVTGLSTSVAVGIATIEVLGLLDAALGAAGKHGVFQAWTASVDLNEAGYAIVGLFVATWAVSAAIWKFGRIEERWSVVPQPAVRDEHDA